MKASKTSLGLGCVVSLIAMAVLLTAIYATAQTEKFLHSFSNNGKDGTVPASPLIFDASGNLYGSTYYGGPSKVGTVYELSPRTGGGWSERVLHNFQHNGQDGNSPEGTLTFDASGNLYGTTNLGGTYKQGTVFELSPKSGGGWTEKVLYNFGPYSTDGVIPNGGVTFDTAGNLYGTTLGGGNAPAGTVFELSPTSSGNWTETILFNFDNTNGGNPEAGVIFDSAGNLYGTTSGGGASFYGTVFELSPSAGSWVETILYNFNNDGGPNDPTAALIMDSAGNLYGTAVWGAEFGDGAVFELSPSGGSWTETILHAFNYKDNLDGINPRAGLILDAAGNLYGTTDLGGSGSCPNSGGQGCGTVFKLTPSGSSWIETILHRFGNGTDGQQAGASLTFDASGNLYGTAGGGAYGEGVVFEITP